MELRLATMSDLIKIKETYKKIVNRMNENKIEIWNDFFPFEFFEEDINQKRLYILTNETDDILGAFALEESNAGEGHVTWESKDAKAMYINRLGVNVDFSNQGVGTALLNHAMKVAGEKSVEYLRLFVIDINRPAINLYLKNGFSKAGGIFVEEIDENRSFKEYGFEKKI